MDARKFANVDIFFEKTMYFLFCFILIGSDPLFFDWVTFIVWCQEIHKADKNFRLANAQHKIKQLKQIIFAFQYFMEFECLTTTLE